MLTAQHCSAGALLFSLALQVQSCEVCKGVRVDGSVLELSSDALDDTVSSHPLLLLLLYQPWCSRSEHLLKEHAVASGVLGTDITFARVDVSAHPAAATQLGVSITEVPTLRVLRGDALFGYPLRSGMSAAEIASRMREEQALQLGSLELDELAMASLEASSGTRVVASLCSEESITAFEQVAAAFAGTITFAMHPKAATPSSLKRCKDGAGAAAL